MSGTGTVVFLVQRVGPYHDARLCAWAAIHTGPVMVVEYRPGEGVYAWAAVTGCRPYERRQTRSNAELGRCLEVCRPEVVVCVGYADPEISFAMTWALQRQVPLVTCSDSTYADEARSWSKEMLKRRVIAAFDAALVAGSRAGDYLRGMGLEGQRQFRPWDVVDNGHFAAGADLGRNDTSAERARLKLPERFFLCVARFVPKKNLPRLIEAYARYAAQAGSGAWSLVLSGSGPQEAELRQQVADAELGPKVFFPGFLQHVDLPVCYGLAGALVLPSVSDQWGLVVNEAMAAGLPVLVSGRCGCAPDLVREGENGFTFEPEDVAGLARCLKQLAEMDPIRRTAMGFRSREIIAAFSPAAFAQGLEAAVACARQRRPSRRAWLTRPFFRLLAMRSVTSS